MKKLFLTGITLFVIPFLAPLLCSAQISSEIRDMNNAVVTGDTFYYWMPPATTHQVDFNQYNISSTSVTYKVTKIQNPIVAGASAWFCVYHNGDSSDVQSHCYLPSLSTTPHTFVTANGDFNMLLVDFYSGPNYGVSIITYKVFDVNNPNDTALITLVYNVTPVGVADSFVGEKLGEPYPNPAATEFSMNYDLGSITGDVRMVVYNTLGEVVRSESLNGTAGTFRMEVATLENGVYIAALEVNGSRLSAKRLMVSH